MDGVPFMTQNPIPPGRSHLYDFPLKEHGTYWMHSHYSLQEQYLVSASMVSGLLRNAPRRIGSMS